MRSRTLVPVLALTLTGVIASCENNITNIAEGFNDTATWRANMDAAQETPAPNLAGASNPNGRIWFTDNGTTLTYYMEYSGLSSNVTQAHIHRAAVGVAGPIIVPLNVLLRQSGTVAGTIDMTATDVAPQSPTENVSPDSLRTLLNNGNAYVNVHTANNGPGEIRGQVARN
jgi:CHRD domain